MSVAFGPTSVYRTVGQVDEAYEIQDYVKPSSRRVWRGSGPPECQKAVCRVTDGLWCRIRPPACRRGLPVEQLLLLGFGRCFRVGDGIGVERDGCVEQRSEAEIPVLGEPHHGVPR